MEQQLGQFSAHSPTFLPLPPPRREIDASSVFCSDALSALTPQTTSVRSSASAYNYDDDDYQTRIFVFSSMLTLDPS